MCTYEIKDVTGFFGGTQYFYHISWTEDKIETWFLMGDIICENV